MTPPPIISNQADLIRALDDGGKLYQTRDPKHFKPQWWIRWKNNVHTRVLFSTAEAARNKGHIEPDGLLYWNLTTKAKALIKKVHTP